MLRERLGLSERRACQIMGQHLSTQRHEPRRGGDRDDAPRVRLRKVPVEHPRWGYRLASGAVRKEGWSVNRKKIQRLWREEGLRVPQRKRKRYRLGESTVTGERLRAESTSTRGRRWRSGSPARSMPSTRSVCSTGSCASAAAGRSCRMDNGPEVTANALRDWCRFGRAGSSQIEPGSPWQNPFVESFGSRVRDEVLPFSARPRSSATGSSFGMQRLSQVRKRPSLVRLPRRSFDSTCSVERIRSSSSTP
jgi:putative transposase